MSTDKRRLDSRISQIFVHQVFQLITTCDPVSWSLKKDICPMTHPYPCTVCSLVTCPSDGQISSHRSWADHISWPTQMSNRIYALWADHYLRSSQLITTCGPVSRPLPVVQSVDHYLWSGQLIITCGPVSWSLPVVQSVDDYLWSSQLIITCGPVSRSLPVVQSVDHYLWSGQ